MFIVVVTSVSFSTRPSRSTSFLSLIETLAVSACMTPALKRFAEYSKPGLSPFSSVSSRSPSAINAPAGHCIVLFCSVPSEDDVTSTTPLSFTTPTTFIVMAPRSWTDSNRKGLPAVVSTFVSVISMVTGIPIRLIVMLTCSLVVTCPPSTVRVWTE